MTIDLRFGDTIEQMKLIPDKKYTPAEVMNMYIRSSFSPEQFLKLLSQKSK